MWWANFHFLRPWWLLLVPIVLLFFSPSFKKSISSSWQNYIEPHLLPHLLVYRGNNTQAFYKKILWPLWTLLVIIALAGPTVKKLPADVGLGKAPLIIVLEVTEAMLSSEVEPNRIKRSLYKLEDLTQHYNGGEIGLVAFAGDAHVVAPLTQDYNTIITLAKSLTPELMPRSGFNPELAIQTAKKMIERRNRAIILMITASDLNNPAISSLSDQGIIIWSFAGKNMVDQGIAHKNFLAFTSDNRDIDFIVDRGANDTFASIAKDYFYDTWVDLGPYFLLVATIIFMLAYFFAQPALLIALIIFMPSSSVKAFSLKDWFLRNDQKGQQAYEIQDYSRAAQLFEDDFRKGSSFYKAKNYDEAINYLSRVNTSDGRYNLGNAYAQKGQYQEAIKSYAEALSLDPHNADAQANKELLEKMQQNSNNNQEKQDKQKEKQQEKQEQNKPESDQNQNDQSNNQENSSKEQPGQQSKPSSNDAEKEQARKEEGEQGGYKENKPLSGTKPEEQKQKPKSFTNQALDQETRYYFDQLENNNSLYLKRKFRYESEKNSERK